MILHLILLIAMDRFIIKRNVDLEWKLFCDQKDYKHNHCRLQKKKKKKKKKRRDQKWKIQLTQLKQKKTEIQIKTVLESTDEPKRGYVPIGYRFRCDIDKWINLEEKW